MTKRTRPKVTVQRPTAGYEEATIEFTFPDGTGGKACFLVRKGVPTVEFYRLDDEVRVEVHPKHVLYDGESPFNTGH